MLEEAEAVVVMESEGEALTERVPRLLLLPL